MNSGQNDADIPIPVLPLEEISAQRTDGYDFNSIAPGGVGAEYPFGRGASISHRPHFPQSPFFVGSDVRPLP
ncbi:MAG: hypothetical protein O2875_07970 [Planctomycetota bacterium]|nr:hypothetical protein [Planctomycetota bacterium]